MNWILGFEIMCYTIVVILLIDIIRKKDWDSLFTFGSAAIVGFVMELMAVAVTDIYYYNPNFLLNLGAEPKQFPVFGGFMWGGLTVCGIKLAKKFSFGKWMTAFTAGMLIVTMDILLDVVAIRLDGGFWTWVGNPINTEISQHTFMSVIWVNFLGYLIETPTVVMLTLRKNEKIKENEFGKQILHMFLIAFGAIIVTAVGSLIALGANMLTDDWFACIAFSAIWLTLMVLIIKQAVSQKLRPVIVKGWNLPVLIFWLAMYGYCIAAMAHLGFTDIWWFTAIGILFAASTVYLCISEPKKAESEA